MTTRFRTWILIAGLSGLFIALGGAIGGSTGIIGFAVLAAFFNLVMFWFSDSLALKMSKAQPLDQSAAPELYLDVAELSGKAGIPAPRLYLIPSEQPNAFAAGRSHKKSVVAVTQGLLSLMPRDQVRGVIAHELAHIKNRDVLVITIAAMIGAAVSAIANFLQFQWLFGGNDDDNPLGAVGAIVAIIVAPLAAIIIQMAVSRQREFLADETAAKIMGDGQPLAGALANLERGVQAIPMHVNPATASLYIANPLAGRGMAALFSTHPPIPKRIERLRRFDSGRGIHW